MTRIGFRELHFVKESNIAALIAELKTSVGQWKIPKEYDLRIYEGVYSCCGISEADIRVEIIGPTKKK